MHVLQMVISIELINHIARDGNTGNQGNVIEWRSNYGVFDKIFIESRVSPWTKELMKGKVHLRGLLSAGYDLMKL
jgi:hypothetical protein